MCEVHEKSAQKPTVNTHCTVDEAVSRGRVSSFSHSSHEVREWQGSGQISEAGVCSKMYTLPTQYSPAHSSGDKAPFYDIMQVRAGD